MKKSSLALIGFFICFSSFSQIKVGTTCNIAIGSATTPGTNTINFTTNGTERMRINSSGQVGIGTSPSRLFQVGGTDPIVVFGDEPYTTTNNLAGFVFERYTDGSLYSSFKTITGGKIYFRSGAGTETAYARTFMTVDPSNGNIGIGTSSNPDNERVRIDAGTDVSLATNNTNSGSYPYAHKFWVNNNTIKCMAIINGTTDKFYVYGDGKVNSAVGYYTFSDGTLKTNVNGINGALSKVLSLNGVTYNYKSDLNSLQMGLIAQDVEKTVPEVVMTNENGLKSLAYQNLVPLLIEAIKEQNSKINTLETQLNYCCTSKQQRTNNNNNTQPDHKQDDLNNNILQEVPPNNMTNDGKASLLQNNPNPFNRQTTIEYYLPTETQSASLMIFDMQGKLIKTVQINSYNKASVTINANELSPGMFIYSLVADGKEVDNKRMILTE